MDNKRYIKFKKLALKITKNDERTEDLLHDVLIELQSNKKWNEIKNNDEQLYFLSRVLSNQFNSNNSKFYRTYKKYKFEESDVQETSDTSFKEKPTLEWVNEILDKELKDNPENWYNIELFKLFLEFKKIELIHKKTQIPKYSIRKTIKEMKKWINNKWIEIYGD